MDSSRTGRARELPARTGWLLAFAAAVLLQLVVLYAPTSDGGPGVPGLDKLIHVAVFAAAAFTGRRAALPLPALAGALLAHAALSELVQATVLPTRAGDPLDVLADAVGVALGLGLAGPLRRTPSEATHARARDRLTR